MGTPDTACLIVICTREGVVERVLRDDLGWAPTAVVGQMLATTDSQAEAGLAAALRGPLASGGAAFGVPVTLVRPAAETPMVLAVTPAGSSLLVVAAPHVDLLAGLAREARLALDAPGGSPPHRAESDEMLYRDTVRLTTELASAQRGLAKANAELERALAEVRALSGLLSVCAWCRKVRDDAGRWVELESFVRDNSSAEITHCCCPDCLERLSGE